MQNTDNTGIEEYVTGHVVVSDLETNMFNDISYENNVDILASEYVRPKPLTGYTPTRNEIGDRSGTKVLPQTHIPSKQIPISSQHYTPF
jgi:hypothetical protein